MLSALVSMPLTGACMLKHNTFASWNNPEGRLTKSLLIFEGISKCLQTKTFSLIENYTLFCKTSKNEMIELFLNWSPTNTFVLARPILGNNIF